MFRRVWRWLRGRPDVMTKRGGAVLTDWNKERPLPVDHVNCSCAPVFMVKDLCFVVWVNELTEEQDKFEVAMERGIAEEQVSEWPHVRFEVVSVNDWVRWAIISEESGNE